MKDDSVNDLVNEIRCLADEVPENGMEYAESRLETVNGIHELYEANGHISPDQLCTLKNIKSCLKIWIRDSYGDK